MTGSLTGVVEHSLISPMLENVDVPRGISSSEMAAFKPDRSRGTLCEPGHGGAGVLDCASLLHMD